MNPELTKLIEQYLADELSANDTKAFEDRITTNATLRHAVTQQREIHEGAKRAYQRQQIVRIGKKYHFHKNLLRGGLSLLIVSVIVLGSWLLFNTDHVPHISDEVKTKLSALAPIDLESQYFVIPEDGGVVLSRQGVLISVPKDAFLNDGKPYQDAVALQFQEALSGIDILTGGLSTTSNGQLLETGGMISVTGFTIDGEPLDFNPEVGVYIQVPVKDEHGDMQLFDGERKADGSINWVNPEQLEKIPVPVSMSELDFYPSGYEDFLNKYRWKKSKKSRDSLYLSFEEEGCGWYLSKNTPDEMPLNIDRVVYTNKTQNNLVEFTDWHPLDPPQFIAVQDDITLDDLGEGLEISNADSIVGYAKDAQNYIPPSKVLGFWKNSFNKTNLATREFEQRMQTIHATCNNAVLDIYLNNLDQSLKYCDDQVVAMGFDEFSKYAAENVGKLNVSNPHLEHLNKFYKNSVKQLKQNNAKLQEIEHNRRKSFDTRTRNSRQKETIRSLNREVQAYDDEFQYNLDNVYAQLGRTRGFTITAASSGIAVTAARSAVKNIDRLVATATVNRTTTTITDPETGKKAEITYNDFTFEVDNADQYIKLFAYLMPYEINSYQRISGKNGKFDHPLNSDMRYNIAVVGVKKDGFGFFQQLNVNAGYLGKIDLKTVSESKLNADIKQMNQTRNSNPMSISEELVWLRQEQKDFTEQKLRQKMHVFRTSIQCIIFPCCCFTEAAQQDRHAVESEENDASSLDYGQ